MSLNFKDDEKTILKAVKGWWETLEDDRGQRAELRRAAGSPGEAYWSPAFQRGFAAHLRRQGLAPTNSELARLAPAAVVLAQARTLADASLPRLLALSGKGSEEVRDVRFRKLLSRGDRDALARELCRMVKLIGGQCDVKSVVTGVFFWGDAVRRRWAEDYYSYTA